MSDAVIEGGCLCGAVRFALRRPTLSFSHCHCESCRRAHAAPVVSWTAVPEEQFGWLRRETVRSYASSSHATRSFCGTCGTPVHYASTDWAGRVYVPVCALDGLPDQQPEEHVNCAEAVPWLTFDDELPRLKGFDG